MCEDWWMHIFGYGSLVWRPAFPFERMCFGYIKGWRRRFWQGSIDHRGVPGSPGLVVTLLPDDETFPEDEKYPDEEPIVWGVVFSVLETKAAWTLDYLDFRERTGYIRTQVDVFGPESSEEPIVRGAILYAAGPDNEHYTGPASADAMARTIAYSVGASGPNTEYLFKLVEALRVMNIYDPHCEDLYRRTHDILGLPCAPHPRDAIPRQICEVAADENSDEHEGSTAHQTMEPNSHMPSEALSTAAA
eukprot:TRINITY_DN2232_c0_g1_i1.p1 TRINITY_DN2232_c0_g1~~TRINITY_DN2232_c0_g1_i1.p1  ORF type:complete len:247 (-),score=39.49 TRINITY_DN2232_c0_g1_i1:142-882(-)